MNRTELFLLRGNARYFDSGEEIPLFASLHAFGTLVLPPTHPLLAPTRETYQECAQLAFRGKQLKEPNMNRKTFHPFSIVWAVAVVLALVPVALGQVSNTQATQAQNTALRSVPS